MAKKPSKLNPSLDPKKTKPPTKVKKPQKQPKQSSTPAPVSTPKTRKKTSLLSWLWQWVIVPMVLLVLTFHILVAGLIGIWKVYPVNNSMFMLSHRLSGGTVSQKWLDYEQIPKNTKQAVIASEDANFAYHNGFDFTGIQTAIQKNNQAGKITMGGSTISQQLAKNLFLTSHRSYLRKTEEAIITLMIEKSWSKERILEVYLNVVEFGNGVYGIESASWHYFGKTAKSLNREESALLVAMLTRPKYYEKNLDNAHLRKKQQIIVKRMNSAVLPKPEPNK